MNAKEEFIKFVQHLPKVRCVNIQSSADFSEDVSIILKEGYNSREYQAFLDKLDFNYNDGYGGQYLYIYSTIWFIDGTWADRGAYDGSEWWDYQKCPSIPQHLTT